MATSGKGMVITAITANSSSIKGRVFAAFFTCDEAVV
jgi:hypothetical protein